MQSSTKMTLYPLVRLGAFRDDPEEKTQVAENNQKKSVASVKQSGVQSYPMTPQEIPEKIMFRPTADDFNLVRKLGKKLGLGQSQILRLALRRLADAEGVKTAN